MPSPSRTSSWARRAPALIRTLLLLLFTLPLAGCLLISGAQQSADRAEDAGNVSVQFVSAEGSELRQVNAADGATRLDVTVFAHAERGQLRIEVLDPSGSAVLVIEGTPDEQVARGTVPTDAAGNLRYRIRATGAQRGGFQLLYQPAGG
jgi:hypothetical protein